ncbi:MAG: NAD(P)-dependent oxidoreductase [Chitinophagales bacterium]
MKKKIVVTGAAGFLGYHLLRLAEPVYEVYGLYHNRNAAFANAAMLRCDITNYIETGNIIDDIEPDAIIHLAAISDANYCQQHKEESFAVNVQATENLAGICSDLNIPFVFASTDLVFDGKKGRYRETDAKNPLSLYGEQKAKAEEDTLKIYPNSLVLRLPLMFGSQTAGEGKYLQQFLAKLQAGEKVKLFLDEYRSVCGAKSISAGILHFLFKQSGVLHLAGKQRLSRYEFGLKAAKAFGLNEGLIESCLQKDVTMAAPRPADVSMDISKALALGYSPLLADEELKLIAKGEYL